MKLAALITRGTHKYELAYVTGNKKNQCTKLRTC